MLVNPIWNFRGEMGCVNLNSRLEGVCSVTCIEGVRGLENLA